MHVSIAHKPTVQLIIIIIIYIFPTLLQSQLQLQLPLPLQLQGNQICADLSISFPRAWSNSSFFFTHRKIFMPLFIGNEGFFYHVYIFFDENMARFGSEKMLSPKTRILLSSAFLMGCTIGLLPTTTTLPVDVTFSLAAQQRRRLRAQFGFISHIHQLPVWTSCTCVMCYSFRIHVLG